MDTRLLPILTLPHIIQWSEPVTFQLWVLYVGAIAGRAVLPIQRHLLARVDFLVKWEWHSFPNLPDRRLFVNVWQGSGRQHTAVDNTIACADVYSRYCDVQGVWDWRTHRQTDDFDWKLDRPTDRQTWVEVIDSSLIIAPVVFGFSHWLKIQEPRIPVRWSKWENSLKPGVGEFNCS